MIFEIRRAQLELTVIGFRVQRALPKCGCVRLGSRPASITVERRVAVAAGSFAEFGILKIFVQVIVDALEKLVKIDESNVALISEFEFGEVQVPPDMVVDMLEVLEVHLGILH